MNGLFSIVHSWIISAGAVGVFGASLAEELISVIPSAAVQTASGAFMMSGYSWSFASLVRLFTTVVIPASFGVMIGSLPYMYLSRRYGKAFISRWGRYIGIHNSDINTIAKKMENNRWDEVLFISARAFPVIPSIALAVYAGIVQMSLAKYIITTLIGVVLRATVFGIAGWLFTEWVSSLKNISNILEQVGIIVITIFVVWIFWKIYKKKFNKK